MVPRILCLLKNTALGFFALQIGLALPLDVLGLCAPQLTVTSPTSRSVASTRFTLGVTTAWFVFPQ